MPGFMTQFGVTYVQYIVPSAKSADAKGDGMKLVYLQYWILHCTVTGLLSQLGGLLWWIPLSTHIIFLLWSYLILPQAIRKIYSIIELELFTFGILKRRGRNNNENDDAPPPVISVSDTKTVKFLNSFLSRLPTATNDTDDDNSNSNSNSNSSDNNKLADDSSSSGEEDDHDINADNAKTEEEKNREIIAVTATPTDTDTNEGMKEENDDSAPPPDSTNHDDDDHDDVSKPSSPLVSAVYD